MSARRTLREMLREVDEIPVEHGRSYHLRVQLVSGDDERVEANLGELTLDQLQKLSRGPKAQVRTALLDVAGELLTSQEVGDLPELTPAAVAEAIGDHFLTLAADNGRDGYAKGRRDTEKDIAAGLLNGQEYQDWSKGEPGAGPLLSALRQHYSNLLTSQSHAAYGSGYRKAQADAATPPEPIRISSSSGTLDFTAGRKGDFDRGRWAGSNEAAASVARQLYGAAGAHVANAADLIALVRSEQDRKLDPWQGPDEPGPWAKHAYEVRADTLRAVASWLSQNWGVRLDSNPEWLTTPEALGARITSAVAERVARDSAHTYTETEIHNAETRRETRVCRHLLTAVGAPVPQDETENLVREDVAAVLRKQIDEQARERASRLRTDGINEGRHAMARFVLRRLNHPDKVAKLDPEQSASSQVAAELKKAFAHARWLTLQTVSNRLYGPDPADNTYGQLPKDITAEQFADAVMKDRSFHGAAVDTTLQEVVRQLGGGDAGEEPVNTVQDVVEFVRRRVADEACSVAYRITRMSLGFMAAREVAAAGSDPEKCITVAGDAVRAELAIARNAQRTSPANARYAELRRRYSAEHDAQHHTRDEFIQGSVALLLGPNEAVQTENTTGDGHRLTLTSTPAQLWPFAHQSIDGWFTFDQPRRAPWSRRITEAAALLMCALEMPDEPN